MVYILTGQKMLREISDSVFDDKELLDVSLDGARTRLINHMGEEAAGLLNRLSWLRQSLQALHLVFLAEDTPIASAISQPQNQGFRVSVHHVRMFEAYNSFFDSVNKFAQPWMTFSALSQGQRAQKLNEFKAQRDRLRALTDELSKIGSEILP